MRVLFCKSSSSTKRKNPAEMHQYGHELRRDHFLLRDDLVNFNHGSFGAVPKCVMQELTSRLHEVEIFPDLWFRETIYKLEEPSRDLISELIKADKEDVVLVENTSYAVNSVLRSFPFQNGDKVLVFSTAYRMVLDTLKFLQQLVGLDIEVVDIPYPLDSPQQMIDAVAYSLSNTKSVKMCIFSHISSMPTIIEPINELTKLAKDHGCVVMIDGAHAPGVVDIDVQSIGADLYTGNCHKWLFAPKGCAFLWTSRQYRLGFINSPQPVVISSTGMYDYVGRFAYTGTRDYTAFVTLPACFSFIDKQLGGMENMRQYCRELLRKGCDLLVKEWNTGYLVPLSMQGFMANVILPCKSLAEAEKLQLFLIEHHSVYVVVSTVISKKRESIIKTAEDDLCIVFFRISAQVYLEYKDFELLARLVREYFESQILSSS